MSNQVQNEVAPVATEGSVVVGPELPPVAPVAPVAPAKVGDPDFGSGRFSAAARELFNDLLRMAPKSFTRAEAEKIARDWSSDVGRAFNIAPSTIKHGKTSDGKMSLADASKISTMETRNLTLARLVEHLTKAAKTAKGLDGVKVTFEINW